MTGKTYTKNAKPAVQVKVIEVRGAIVTFHEVGFGNPRQLTIDEFLSCYTELKTSKDPKLPNVTAKVEEKAREYAGLKAGWDRADEEYYNRQAVEKYDAYLFGYQQACTEIMENYETMLDG